MKSHTFIILSLVSSILCGEDEINAKVGIVLKSDFYICQEISKFNKPVEKYWTVKIHNVSSYNIFSQKSRQHIESFIFDKDVKIKIKEIRNDTIIGDVEFVNPKSKRKNLISQVLVQNGWSCYLGETKDMGLQLLEEKARENKKGIWEIFDPRRVKEIQDSCKRVLDSVIQEYEISPQDTMYIL